MYLSKRTIRNLVVFFTAFIVLEFVPLIPGMDDLAFTQVKNAIFCVLWIDTVYRRIVRNRIRNKLIAITSLLIFLTIVQGIKYNDTGVIPLMEIHLWYLYYVTFIFSPALSFMTATEMSTDITGKIYRKYDYGVLAVCFILFLIVITNDYHQLVFVFSGNRQNWSAENYVNGPLFYVVWAYLSIVFLGAFAISLKAFSNKRLRRYIWIPAGIMLFLSLYSLFYNINGSIMIAGVSLFHIQSVFSLCVIGYWESLIDIGVITSNADYDALFYSSHLNSLITDKNLDTVYRSEQGFMLSTTLKKNALTAPVAVDYNTILRSAPITGGYVFWEDDISATRILEEELEETRIVLKETNTILEAENKIKEKQVQYEIQNQLFNSVDELTAYEKNKILKLISDYSDSDFNDIMAQCTVYGAYIKRMANLVLISGNEEMVDSDELYLSCRESFDYLRLSGISCTVEKNGNMLLNGRLIINIYQIIQEVIEEALETRRAVDIVIDCSESFKVNIVIDFIMDVEEMLSYYIADLEEQGGEAQGKTEDGVTYVRIGLKGGFSDD